MSKECLLVKDYPGPVGGDFPGITEAALHDGALDEHCQESGEDHSCLECVCPQNSLHPTLESQHTEHLLVLAVYRRPICATSY